MIGCNSSSSARHPFSRMFHVQIPRWLCCGFQPSARSVVVTPLFHLSFISDICHQTLFHMSFASRTSLGTGPFFKSGRSIFLLSFRNSLYTLGSVPLSDVCRCNQPPCQSLDVLIPPKMTSAQHILFRILWSQLTSNFFLHQAFSVVSKAHDRKLEVPLESPLFSHLRVLWLLLLV